MTNTIRSATHALTIAAAAALLFVLTACGKPLSMSEVLDKGEGIQNPQEAAERIHAADNKRKYEKGDVKAADGLDAEGYVLYKAKRDREAINKYRKALEVYPLAKTYYNLGNSLMNVNEYDKAVVAYRTALAYLPKNYLYNYNLACAYSLKRDIKQSLEYLEKALELGYNAFGYIYADPDMKNARIDPHFDTIMAKYKADKMTDDKILQIGFCESNYGYMLQRYQFGRDKVCTVIDEGVGPYAQSINKTESLGTWTIEDGRLYILMKDNRTGESIKVPLYVKLRTKECSLDYQAKMKL